jgi:type VI secretion system protein ImpF
MPRADSLQAWKPSVLDRLSDPAAGGSVGREGYGLRQIEEAVRRDLEDLLNTRRPPDTWTDEDGHERPFFEGLEEVPTSIANYGLRDLVRLDALTPEDRGTFAAHIAEVIANFEPRLTDVRVTVRDPEEVEKARRDDFRKTALYFHISARLALDPSPDVAFETVLELTKGHHQVLKDAP